MILWLASYPKSGNTWIRMFLRSYFLSSDQKFSLRTFWKLIKSFIKSSLNFFNPYYTSWFVNKKIRHAFENIINGKTSSKIAFDKKKVLTNNISHLKKNFPWKKYLINFHIVKTYYWLNVLASYSDIKKKKFVAEIGGGNGNLISLLKHHYNNKYCLN